MGHCGEKRREARFFFKHASAGAVRGVPAEAFAKGGDSDEMRMMLAQSPSVIIP
jgi:hypothetical protein